MQIKVHDPRHVIDHVRLLVQTPEAVVLYVNLHRKYTGLTGDWEDEGHRIAYLDDGAEIHVPLTGLPKEHTIVFGSGSKYELWLCFVPAAAIDAAAVLYKDPANH